jgi:hypothetical protein
LDGSRFNKTILIFVDDSFNDPLKPISQKLGENFDGCVQEGNGPEISN